MMLHAKNYQNWPMFYRDMQNIKLALLFETQHILSNYIGETALRGISLHSSQVLRKIHDSYQTMIITTTKHK